MHKPDTHACVLHESFREYAPGYGLPSDGWIDGRGFAEAIKGSARQKLTLAGAQIMAGREDCIDLVRGRELRIVSCRLHIHSDSPARQFITAKGSIVDLELDNLLLHGEPSGWFPFGPRNLVRPDIVLGDHTLYDYDLSRPPMRQVVIGAGVRHVTGRPVTVLAHHAVDVRVCSNRIHLLTMPRALTSARFWAIRQQMRLTGRAPTNDQLARLPWETA